MPGAPCPSPVTPSSSPLHLAPGVPHPDQVHHLAHVVHLFPRAPISAGPACTVAPLPTTSPSPSPAPHPGAPDSVEKQRCTQPQSIEAGGQHTHLRSRVPRRQIRGYYRRARASPPTALVSGPRGKVKQRRGQHPVGKAPGYLLGPSHGVGMALHQLLEGDGLHVQDTGDLQSRVLWSGARFQGPGQHPHPQAGMSSEHEGHPPCGTEWRAGTLTPPNPTPPSADAAPRRGLLSVPPMPPRVGGWALDTASGQS